MAVDEKKKRLHYERIRIQEDREEMKQDKDKCDKMEQDIEDMVYSDTKEQQVEKHRISNQIDELDQEIQTLEQQLNLKRKNKEMLELEMNVYEK